MDAYRQPSYFCRNIFSLCITLMTVNLAQLASVSDTAITVAYKVTMPGSAELTCTVPNLGKRRIIWMKLTEPFPLSVGTTRFIPDKRMRVTSEGRETVKLTIREVTRQDGGEYECRVSGEETLAKIISLVIPVPADSTSTYLLDTDTDVTAKVGDTVMLPCHVKNLNPRMVLWKKSNSEVISLRKKVFSGNRRVKVVHDRAEEWSLRLTRLRAEDFGTYTCMVNSRPVLTRTVTLSNSAPVEMVPKLLKNSKYRTKVTADEGDDVTLHCDFQANPPAKVTWYISTKDSTGKNVNTEVGRGNSFTLHQVTPANAAKYVCMGKNGLRPHGRGRTTLTVKARPTTVPPTTTTFIPRGPTGPRLYHHEERVGIHRGENQELQCTAIGWPRPAIYWRYQGRRLVNDYKYRVTESLHGRHEKTSTLLVRSLSLRDYGSYECVARNQYGRTEIQVELYETAWKQL